VVFEALTERGDQLRQLIENSNRVFETTALRDTELQEALRALPTFESESRQTVDRLAEFAQDTDPLVTQLRPAARELSPTLQDLGALAPDLRSLFRELGPLIDASERGFPAAERVLDDARPLLAQLDPAMRQLTPILDFIGLYRGELTAFFANTAAATQARDARGIHYLRTTNPLNPENLAVHPTRIGTNRPNPYQKPGAFSQLANGLPVFDDRHCGNRVPPATNTIPAVSTPPVSIPGVIEIPPVTLTPQQMLDLVPDDLLSRVNQFAYGGGTVAAPSCRRQGPFDYGGEQTQYPHVRRR
jgi:phospholipid/cholesterol/gamma-HCH transport system substrate-binding protein